MSNNTIPPTTWALLDPNTTTKQWVVDIATPAQLQHEFASRIEFGTAGLRAPFGPGPSKMNELVVMQTAQGICIALEQQNLASKGFVVGYDHRTSKQWACSSHSFALITAAVFLSRGHQVYLFNDIVATPLVPFAIQELHAGGGVMITASHNPKQDAGYKVYWSNACQIISPIDDIVSKCIVDHLEPWKNALQQWSNGEQMIRQACTQIQNSIVDQYLSQSQAKLCRNPSNKLHQDFLIKHVCYTPMHGVGLRFALAMFSSFGFSVDGMHVVQEQAQPDAEFPTVQYPNPEEKGALTLAMRDAERLGLSLILANDPDADRLAVAERSTTTTPWTVFTGDEIAALLAWWEIEKYNAKVKTDSQFPKGPAMVVSAVSSMFVKHFAEQCGVRVFETLTGFKYIGNLVLNLRQQGYQVLFSYEEAIGFCVGDVVVDKDGLTAASVFAEMACTLRNRDGLTCVNKLTELRNKYGCFLQRNGYIKTTTPAHLFQHLRGPSGHFPLLVGRNGGGDHGKPVYRVIKVRDLGKGNLGIDSDNPPTFLPVLPRTSMMITLHLDAQVKITLRASGTEPKLKYYVEAYGTNNVQHVLDDVVDRIVLGELLKGDGDIAKL